MLIKNMRNKEREFNSSLKPGEVVFVDNWGISWRVFVNESDFIIPEDAVAGETLGYSNCSCEHVHPVKLRVKNGKMVKYVSTGYY